MSVFFLSAYAAGLLLVARIYRDQLPFLNLATLNLQLELSMYTSLTWVLLGIISALAPRRIENSAFFSHAPIQFFAFSNSVYAYMMGLVTAPYGAIVFLGGVLPSLLLFGSRPTIAGSITFLVMVFGLSISEQMNWIPYGPLLQSSPIIDGQLSGAWLMGIGSVSTAGILLSFGLGMYMLHQLTVGDEILAEKQEALITANRELGLAASENQKARDELEIRVEERTNELTLSNERMRSEMKARIKASDELHSISSVMESALDGVARVDGDGRIQYANAAFSEMYREVASAMVGTPANDWIDPEDRGRFIKTVMNLGLGQKEDLTAKGIRADGTTFPQQVAIISEKNSKERSHYRFVRDVTGPAHLMEQLNQSMKIEAIGRFAGNIAQEFDELLSAILSSTERLRAQIGTWEKSDVGLEVMNEINTAATRAKEMSSPLLAFGRVRPSDMHNIYLNRSLGQLIELHSTSFGDSIEVVTEFCADPLLTTGESSRFESGLLNVVLNARDAMPEGGRLTLRTRPVEIRKDDPLLGDTHSGSKGFCRIDVIDDGMGIESATLDKILDPFFTTKLGSAGLGLSVFASYLHEVGGTIRFESVLGEGTTCSIYVPLAANDDAKTDTLFREFDGTETILLGERHGVMARTLTLLLSRSGYRVTCCEDGRKILDAFHLDRARWDLVIVDFGLPEISGVEVFEEIQRTEPGFPVVLMSRDIARPEFQELDGKGLRAIMKKPCSRKDLLATVRGALDSEA